MSKINKEIINKVTETLLKKTNKRSTNILVARFGLEQEKKQSLSKIGDSLKITRERVRQIEANALKQLQKSKKDSDFNDVIDKVKEIIIKQGGLCVQSAVGEYLISGLDQVQKNKIMLLLKCSSKLVFNKATLKNNSFWTLKNGIKKKEIESFNQFVINQLNEIKKSIKLKDIKEMIFETKWKSVFTNENGDRKMSMFLLIDKQLKRNLLGEWGIKNWRSVSERGNKEKAYLVLKKKKKPLHFRKIADHINIYWTHKRSLPQTVHNELIKDDRFVLVGRGTYGLSEWGLKGGTVREIIVSLFEKKQDPLHIDEIIDHVFSHKEVKRTTILVNLADQEHFVKKGEGKYFLR
ncbi:MAG: hypothetical protein KAQ63_01200 [Candidatus Moranbacteria bacterium]|nr:hypothetical protein [Candidatus Moranbacteria bacterium]